MDNKPNIKHIHINRYLDKVEEFHINFEAPVLDIRQKISKERANLRVNLILEELHELAVAFNEEVHFRAKILAILNTPTAEDKHFNFVEIVDALADLQYVLSGTVLEVGAKEVFDLAFEEVHSSNMTKVIHNEAELDKELELFEGRRLPVTVIKNKADNYYFKGEDGKIIKPSTYRKADLERVVKGFLNKNA